VAQPILTLLKKRATIKAYQEKKTMKALGNVGDNDSNNFGAKAIAASGTGMTFTKACGLGASMVADLDFVKARYARVKAIENREAARERAAERRAEREALAFAALDELLDR
jgi:hypothetical protein